MGLHIRVVNPNSDTAMIDIVRAAAQVAAAPGTTVTAVQPDQGPAAIENSVVTLPVRTVAMADAVVRHLGLEHRCVVRGVDLGVSDLHGDEKVVAELLVAASLRAISEDGAEAIVLGCAGLSGVVEAIREATGVPVVDGVAAGVGLAESLVRQGLRTSPIGTHATPQPELKR